MESADLGKSLLTLEEECRVLRGEVALLEKMRRFRVQDAAVIADIPNQDSVSRSTKGGKSQARSLPLPIEAIGDLNSKAGAVTLLMRENKKLIRERQKLQATLETYKTDTVTAEGENAALRERIGCSTEDDSSRVKDPLIAINEEIGLKNDIVEALRERELVQTTIQRQNEILRDLISQLTASKVLDDERDEAYRQLAEKREELNSIRAETYSMRRLLERKDRQLEKEVPVDEVAIASTAETERRVVQHRLEREQENVRLNESSIRHRALQIAKLEKRIEMIGDAIVEEELSTEERVDADLVEQLRKEINSLNRLHREGGARIEILDADIEDLDRRSTGLVRTTANVKKEMKRIEKQHRKYTNAQKKELEIEQTLAEDEINKLQDEIDTLRKFTARIPSKHSKH